MAANLFWGFGFTATIWALQGFHLTQILFLRFLVVGVLGLVWGLRHGQRVLHRVLPLTLIPAVFLVMEILFQVWGLKFTTATNAGFLTVSYILMVPLLEKILWKRSLPAAHWLWVGVGFLGTVLMLEPQKISWDLSSHRGDLLMLVSALGASLHMLSIDRLGKAENRLFFANTMQSLWGALLLLPLVLYRQDPWTWPADLKPWLGLASLTFGSTLLAFYFQMRAQKNLSPSVSSLLFLVESPVAAAFGFFLLGESLSPVQWGGGVLVVVAALGVQRLNRARP
jgi:drug/metabolite transporter (DMT)-like permease